MQGYRYALPFPYISPSCHDVFTYRFGGFVEEDFPYLLINLPMLSVERQSHTAVKFFSRSSRCRGDRLSMTVGSEANLWQIVAV